MSVVFLASDDRAGYIGRQFKSNGDTTRLVVDFSRWLDPGEQIAAVASVSLAVANSTTESVWQSDYWIQPLEVVLTDSDPLVFVGNTISGTQVSLLVSHGTPGITYVVSFLAAGSTSERVKEIDLLVSVNQTLNSNMITSQTPGSSDLTVTGTFALPIDTDGTVFVDNTSGAAITITLPPSPVFGQEIVGVDTAGNALLHNITWVGAGGALINGLSSFVFTEDYQGVTFKWGGSSWVLTTTTPFTAEITVTGTTALASGTSGSVFVNNTTGSPVTITLPSSPFINQTLMVSDVAGNADANNITVVGAGGATINGFSSYVFNAQFQAATFQWSGSGWVIT